MLTQEQIDQFKKELKRVLTRDNISGGQTINIAERGARVKHEELGFDLTINVERTQLANMEIAYELFESFLKIVHNR